MTSNSRPVFCFHKAPKLLWNEVSGALSYKFRLVNQKTSEELWTIKVNNPQFEGGYCQCDYPQDKEKDIFLKPLIPYWFTAEANNEESLLKKFETKVILLEEEVQKAFQKFENSLPNSLTTQEAQELEKNYSLFMKALSGQPNGTGEGGICRPCSFMGVKF